jgi:membrane protein implicated in regulation of membrane protease activity
MNKSPVQERMAMFSWLAVLALLPEGSVRNEGVFFVLLVLLAALIGFAMYLRHKRNKEPDYPTEGL